MASKGEDFADKYLLVRNCGAASDALMNRYERLFGPLPLRLGEVDALKGES